MTVEERLNSKKNLYGCLSDFRGPTRGVSQVACRNFKMSRVGVLSRLHNAVGNLATYIWLRQSFVAISFERCRYFLAHVACRNLHKLHFV